MQNVVSTFLKTYHVNNHEKQNQKYYKQNVYHNEKFSKFENESLQLLESRNVMIDVYFNEHDELKYDLTSYICEHYCIVQIFDNNDELREHVLHYHDFDTRFIDVKNKFQNHNYVKHVEKHVYNYFSKIFFEYNIIETKIFDVELNFYIDIENALSLLNRRLLSIH